MANEKIHEYLQTRTAGTISPDFDFLDFDASNDSGVSYFSARITAQEFVDYVSANAGTYYNSNGTLGGAREVNSDEFDTTWLNGNLIIKDGNTINDRALLVTDGSNNERVRLGYDNAVNSGELVLSNGSGDYIIANDGILTVTGNINSIGNYSLNSIEFIHDRGGVKNSFVGHNSGTLITTGFRNTCLGNGAGGLITDGDSNTCLGNGAGGLITTQDHNVVIGNMAAPLIISSFNTVVGNESSPLATTATQMTSLGAFTLPDLTTGLGNTSIGYASGSGIVAGANNIFLGKSSSADSDISSSFAIGFQSMVTASNQAVIGGSTNGRVEDYYFGQGVSMTAQTGTSNVVFQPTGFDGVLDTSSNYDFVIASSTGTGTGTGGKIIFKTSVSGSTGSTKNPLVDAMTINSDGVVVFKDFTIASGLPSVVAGGFIRISDETGGDTLAYSDGSNWLRVSDGVIAS